MRPDVLSKSVRVSAELSATLAYYRAGMEQPAHAHEYHQISFVLAGTLRENGPARRRALEIVQPGVGVKPAGFQHANRYGREGALLFSLRLHAMPFEGVDLSDWRWRSAFSAAFWIQVGDTVRTVMRETNKGANRDGHACANPDAIDGIEDLLALSGAPMSTPRTNPPTWLERARTALREDERMPLRAIAHDCGVHPVHFSRAFAHAYGCTATVFRSRIRLARAMRLLLDDRATLSEAAFAAGFADQSHFTREARRVIGMAPGRLRQAFAHAG